MEANVLNENEICKEYIETNIGIETLAKKWHVGKIKIKKILQENGVELKKRGARASKEEFKVSDWSIPKYPSIDGYHYVAIDKQNGFSTNDVDNRAGTLTTHIYKEYGIEAPSLYNRKLYYMRTGNYWWEQWFHIEKVENARVKRCPYCDWETVDLENKSGMFESHLRKEHKIGRAHV